MRRRLARHGPRPLRTARAAGRAAHRLRCLPRRLARQQPAEGGPQLRPDGQGHADGPGRARRGAGARRSCSGSSTTTSSTTAWAAASAAAACTSTTPARAAGSCRWRTSTPASPASSWSSNPATDFQPRRPQAGRPGRHAGPAARHRRAPCWPRCSPACCWSRSGAAVPALSRTYIDMFLIGGQTSLLGALFASMGAVRGAHRRADRAATGEPAARPHHLLHAEQRPLPAPSAAPAGHLLRPAQPGRPGPAAPVQRRGGRDPGPRPRRRGRRRRSSSSSTPSCCGPTTPS